MNKTSLLRYKGSDNLGKDLEFPILGYSHLSQSQLQTNM